MARVRPAVEALERQEADDHARRSAEHHARFGTDLPPQLPLEARHPTAALLPSNVHVYCCGRLKPHMPCMHCAVGHRRQAVSRTQRSTLADCQTTIPVISCLSAAVLS